MLIDARPIQQLHYHMLYLSQKPLDSQNDNWPNHLQCKVINIPFSK